MKKMDKNMEKMETRLLPVGSIRVAERIRKDNGGLEELANDIREHGLINPITVMEQTYGGRTQGKTTPATAFNKTIRFTMCAVYVSAYNKQLRTNSPNRLELEWDHEDEE